MTLGGEGAHRIAEAVQRGELTAREVVEAALQRIDAAEPALHAYLHVRREGALRDAAALDRQGREMLRDRPLAGVPVAVKDNLTMAGEPTTAGSKILEGYVPPYTATAVARLMAAGAVVVGKTNLDEFAMGSSTEHSAFGPTRNPWDLTRVPGGSSGGSTAAVAAGTAVLALGSETGGSVRQPAAFCGVVGLKPTYGRVSRYGLIAFASSLDQVGPIGRRVADVALLFQVVAGRDPHDATSVDRPVPDAAAARRGGLGGIRVGVLAEAVEQSGPDSVRAVQQAVAALRDLGATVSEVSLPTTRYGISAYYVVAPAEASSNLARYDGVRYGRRGAGRDLLEVYQTSRGEGFGREVQRRILLGTFALAEGYYDAYYLKAMRTRTLLADDYREAFRVVDVIVSPTVPEPAFRLGEKLADPWSMYVSDVLTVGANLTGLPALSLPFGASAGGLPTAVQLTAPWLEEARLFQVGAALEAARPMPDWPESFADGTSGEGGGGR
jgi:aspartyl-tRNA(Asn)/glutamyl-tRNA(Gln) amidotransferase subunit A